jgi:hypothetical protein
LVLAVLLALEVVALGLLGLIPFLIHLLQQGVEVEALEQIPALTEVMVVREVVRGRNLLVHQLAAQVTLLLQVRAKVIMVGMQQVILMLVAAVAVLLRLEVVLQPMTLLVMEEMEPHQALLAHL